MLTARTQTNNSSAGKAKNGRATIISGAAISPAHSSHAGSSPTRREAKETAPTSSEPAAPAKLKSQMLPIVRTTRAVSGSSSNVSLKTNVAGMAAPTASPASVRVAKMSPPTNARSE